MSSLSVTDPLLVDFATSVGDTGEVAIEGARTRWQVGGLLHEKARLLRAPAGLVEYRPEEMIVRVRAGTPVAELHAVLEEAGQRTGLPERGGTVGGAVAVGENHLETLGRGPVRDAVLEVRYVSAEGELVTGGGPVVKNVSGFNLPKLMVGSLGTLGLLVELVLRTNPVPATSRWLRATGVDPFEVRDALFRPAALLWDGSTTWVKLEGHGADVDSEARLLGRRGAFEASSGPPELPPHRWSMAPSDLEGLARPGSARFVASIGVGTAWVDAPPPPRPPDAGAKVVAERMKQLFDPTGRLNPGRVA